MQACTPVYQLASRSVRIRNRPPWGQDSTGLQGPCRTERRYTRTPVHCYIRRDDLPKPRKSDRHLELARVLPLGRGRVRSRAEAVLLA